MRVSPNDAKRVWQLVNQHFQLDAERESYFCFIINCKKSYSFHTLAGESLTWVNVWPDQTPHIEYKGTNAVLTTHVANCNRDLGDIFPT